MNKEILRRNIEQVIMQPCVDSNCRKEAMTILRNGIREIDNVILVKTLPDDTNAVISLKRYDCQENDYVQAILDSLPEKYRDRLVTIRHTPNWVCYSYLPVFDTDTQAMWDKEYDDYVSAKQAWCDRHGCD